MKTYFAFFGCSEVQASNINHVRGVHSILHRTYAASDSIDRGSEYCDDFWGLQSSFRVYPVQFSKETESSEMM